MALSNIVFGANPKSSFPPSTWSSAGLFSEKPVVSKVESSTQTEYEKTNFLSNVNVVKDKILSVISLHLFFNSNKLDENNISITSLFKLSDEDLIRSLGGKNDKFLFKKTIHALVDELVKNPKDLMSLLLSYVKDNDLLIFALNLVKSKGSEYAVLSSTPSSEFLSAYCYALSSFINNDNNPIGAIHEALKAPVLKDLIVNLTIAMVGASYGTNFLPQEVKNNLVEANIIYNKLF